MTGLKSMVGRFSLLIIVFALGVASVSLWPSLPQSLRKTLGLASTPGAAQLHADTSGAPTPTEAGTEKQSIKLSQEQLSAAHYRSGCGSRWHARSPHYGPRCDRPCTRTGLHVSR